MSDDLVKRLRQPECVYSEDKTVAFWFSSTDKFAAADRIEKLEKALERIADWPDYRLPAPRDIARAALEGKKDDR